MSEQDSHFGEEHLDKLPRKLYFKATYLLRAIQYKTYFCKFEYTVERKKKRKSEVRALTLTFSFVKPSSNVQCDDAREECLNG